MFVGSATRVRIPYTTSSSRQIRWQQQQQQSLVPNRRVSLPVQDGVDTHEWDWHPSTSGSEDFLLAAVRITFARTQYKCAMCIVASEKKMLL